MPDNVADLRPVGERLGSQRLYDEHSELPVEIDPVQRVAIGGGIPQKPKARRPRGKRAKPTPTPPQQSPTPAKPSTTNWRTIIANALQLVGVLAITFGCALIAPALGFIVGGILVVLLGVATDWNVTSK